MGSYPFTKWFRQLWHPSDKELLLYLEDELPAVASGKVGKHLKACWSCKLKRQEIEDSMTALMRYRKASLASRPDFPPAAQRRFVTKLSQITAENANRPLHGFRLQPSGVNSWRHLAAVRLAPGLLIFLLGLVLWIRLNSIPPVSAKELLQRTKQAEAQRILKVAGPVVYQKLQVRRNSLPLRDNMVTWEIWNDASRHQFRQRVEDAEGRRFIPPDINSRSSGNRSQDLVSVPPILTELQQILQANSMDIRRPLSPSTYDSWRQRLPHKSEEVTETRLFSGSKGLALKTSVQGPFAPKAIVEAELTVRVEDWHAVAQYLKVQGEQGIQSFELAETEFQVVALNTLPPSIFADFTRPTPAERAEPRVETRAVDTSQVTPSAAELMAVEIEARYALHRLRACLGEPIETVRTPGGWIEVRGLAKSPERKEELLAELSAVPRIKVSLQTMEEAAREVLSQSQTPAQAEKEEEAALPEEHPSESSTEVRVGRFPVQDDLERYFTGTLQVADPAHLKEKVTELSNQAFSLSQSALAEAWALRRLAEWYPAQETDRLRQSTQWLLEAMVQDHVLELRTKISRSSNLLEPILSSISVVGKAADPTDSRALGGAEPADGAWPDLCLELFYSIEQVDRLTLGLFVGAGLAGEQSQEAVASLRVLLSRLESEVRDLERKVAREFSVKTNLLSRKGHSD